ncbi:hypothetical protein PC115_g9279 [Phytophthora cactorum]|uniref:Tc1-like transposase DDE domain-containing protein n=1 Tax=Phytophthora cactorum TaxID=29920 RepID=A0A8T1DIJ3_9STRA|nr:hypothetical protein PC115_g9279 [Phytophthora cactorum]KAG2939551.1 hypothetical protein PC117_g10877 [Phytophthora cactorum]KAG3002267.1 hypothetical protein PC120_g19812 [Phytophthora cactorum]KAG3168458.1 hypothetical protein C6341_g11328 [Phytophthora cactorum]
MPSRVSHTLPHTVLERQRVLDAYHADRSNWRSIATSNAFPRSTAYDLVGRDRAVDLKRGGARAKSIKVTPETVALLETYLNENCLFKLEAMKTMLFLDTDVKVSASTPSTCNNEVNKAKRQTFAEKLLKHQREGNCIVYYYETNYNTYCKRNQGRAKKGTRAVAVLPPSKGANLQIQCVVNFSIGLVHHRLQRGSIQMYCNAAFVEEIYQKVKKSETEQHVVEHYDMKLLRLGPYSPMCNPVEGCFSVLKAKIKACLAVDREEICDRRRNFHRDEDGNLLTLFESQMRFLEHAARLSMRCMTPTLVLQMELHCRDAVMSAKNFVNMRYET